MVVTPKKNPNGQLVGDRLAGPTNHRFARPYDMRCGHCGHQYVANSCDVHLRRCPKCQNGAASLDRENPQ